MQPFSGNQRPNLLTSLMNMSLVQRLPRKMHLCRSSSNVTRLPSFLGMRQTLTFCSLLTRCIIPCACHAKRRFNVQKWREHVVFCTCWLRNVLRAQTACTFSTSQLPKVLQTWRSGFNFFTCKCASRHNGVHFFDIATSKSAPRLVFCTFWHRNVLRATMARTFSTSQLQKVVRTSCALCILTSKCASRQNRMQLFISHLASWLRTRRFS